MSENSEQIALFDMDGSLFNYEEAMISSLEAMAHPSEPKIENLWELEKQPYLKARMECIKSVPGWWKNLKPIESGFSIYYLAKSIGFDCHILTKGPRSKSIAWMEKLECCQMHFGEEIDVHVTSDKGLTYGKFLFDDYPEYMERWLKWRPRGLGIMPCTPANKDYNHPNVIKWDGTNFEEIKQTLTTCYNRMSQEPLLF